MIRSKFAIVGILFVLVALIAAAAPAVAAGGKDVTVGQFLVQIAEAKHLKAATPVAAADALRGAGFAIPKLPADKVLTEGDVAKIASSLGLNVTTQQPLQPMNSPKVASFLSSLGPEIGGPGMKPMDDDDDNHEGDHHRKRKKNRSRHEPD